MPPRYAYWTILIDQKPTAFRARDREELLPTLHQLLRKNKDVVLKWFARGRLWESPAEAQDAQRAPKPPVERRGRDWRPGGAHRDPRDRFKKRAHADPHRPHTPRAKNDGDAKGFAPREKKGNDRPPKPFAPRGRDNRARPPQTSGGKDNRNRTSFAPRTREGGDRKSFAPRGPAGPRKPWQRDRPAPRRQAQPPPRKPDPSSPDADPTPGKRKPPEHE